MTEHQQRADHFEQLYNDASEGKCGFSGMPFAVCKASICDCFEFPWIQPDDEAANRYFGNQEEKTDERPGEQGQAGRDPDQEPR